MVNICSIKMHSSVNSTKDQSVPMTQLKGVAPGQRVKECPSECLFVLANKMFCVACHKQAVFKLSVIKGHVTHTSSKKGFNHVRLKRKTLQHHWKHATLKCASEGWDLTWRPLCVSGQGTDGIFTYWYTSQQDRPFSTAARGTCIQSRWEKSNVRPHPICAAEWKHTTEGGDPRLRSVCNLWWYYMFGRGYGGSVAICR